MLQTVLTSASYLSAGPSVPGHFSYSLTPLLGALPSATGILLHHIELPERVVPLIRGKILLESVFPIAAADPQPATNFFLQVPILASGVAVSFSAALPATEPAPSITVFYTVLDTSGFVDGQRINVDLNEHYPAFYSAEFGSVCVHLFDYINTFGERKRQFLLARSTGLILSHSSTARLFLGSAEHLRVSNS